MALTHLILVLACPLISAGSPGITSGTNSRESADGPFRQRGYYITFMRMPAYGLPAWKRIVDAVGADGGNMLLLWVAGAFRSVKYPITWRYNQEHANIRHDFVRDLINYAHTKGIRVLLGFTPFGYDGVNQYPLEHPELKAVARDGRSVRPFGIGCWGYNLCPSHPESQRFMLEYVRELVFDHYPNADGLLIESSDYAACHCSDCRARFYEQEFAFVREISAELWARKPDATIVDYPHYFTGAPVPGLGVKAATQPFDPRWTLFFTPHSAPLDPTLIRQARGSLWSDDAPALRRPADVQAGARRARQAGVTGYVPSLEAFSFVATEAEEGQAWLKGRRQVPLGMGWLKLEDPPYDALPMRVNRSAYREFSRNPALPFEQYRDILGAEVFGAATGRQAVDDLLELQAAFALERTWCQPSPVVSPDRVAAMKAHGTLTPAKAAQYLAAVSRLQQIADRYSASNQDGSRELHRAARWVVEQWDGERLKLLRLTK